MCLFLGGVRVDRGHSERNSCESGHMHYLLMVANCSIPVSLSFLGPSISPRSTCSLLLQPFPFGEKSPRRHHFSDVRVTYCQHGLLDRKCILTYIMRVHEKWHMSFKLRK